tara:strand:- start:8617 stop:10380 length:1764 start_codon:yes stop_codon:yes gene_type:complete
MVVNESFLDSATVRENVVSLARNIGYVPRSRTAATAQVTFDVGLNITSLNSTPIATIKAGLVCVGDANNTSHVFSTSEDISAPVREPSIGTFVATFENILLKEGTFLNKTFTVDGSLDQRFILDNPHIDTSTIKVYVKGPSDSSGSVGIEYSLVSNILDVDSVSEIFLVQEVQDERYEVVFGDGIIGKKLENGSVVTVQYIITDGEDGNGIGHNNSFSFAGRIVNAAGGSITLTSTPSVATVEASTNGSEIESISSIKYYAPRIYSSQYRAVTPRDYEAIIKKIYPDTESVAVVGGEEMDPPEFGTVTISIKPKNGTYVSAFNKTRILSQLKQYAVSGINQKIEDLKILYVEIDSAVYFDENKVSTSSALQTKVLNSLTSYSNSVDMNKFGGRFKYSKVQQVIDSTDTAITSNITRVRIRRDLKAAINQFAQYELCYGNQFHVNAAGMNIKSTGFTISNNIRTVYLTDTPNSDLKTGVISIVEILDDGTVNTVIGSAGTVDYMKGEILLTTVNITSTLNNSGVVEVQAIPESNDVVGLKELYLNFSLSKSTINMVRDVISSGDEITGTSFIKDFYTSSYLNGKLIRE